MHHFRTLLLILLLAGCVANGVPDDPVARTFQWPDLMAGNDIRRDCVPGTPDRWRFVYNGVYGEQVRVYEIDAGTVAVRSFDRIPLGFVDAGALDRIAHGTGARTEIGREDLARLIRAWEGDLPKAARPGGAVRSDRFFWAVASCRDGRFAASAFPYPADGTSPFAFPQELARFDRTDSPVNPPRATPDTGDRADFVPGRHSGDTTMRFLLRVMPDGSLQPEY